MSDSTLSTLTQIRNKVRRITRSPSTAQITDAEVDNYINTFILYDFPAQIKAFALRKKLTFYTEPYIDTYETDTTNTYSPLYNFKNKYTGVFSPVYIGGIQVPLFFSEAAFYSEYSKINYAQTVGLGDGAVTEYAGFLTNKPVLRNSIVVTSIDTNNNGLVLKDEPVAGAGQEGLLVDASNGATCGAIDYVTGEYSFLFPRATLLNANVNVQTIAYQASKPQGVLFFENKFILRPVPDQPYPVEIEVAQRPTELLNNTSMPEISQWWQYIALGAAKKVFLDRMDLESIQQIEPEFREQEALCMRNKIDMQKNSRTPSIFSGYELNMLPNGPF